MSCYLHHFTFSENQSVFEGLRGFDNFFPFLFVMCPLSGFPANCLLMVVPHLSLPVLLTLLLSHCVFAPPVLAVSHGP